MIESIPNISEGCHPAIIDTLAEAVRQVPGVYWLDRSSDASHNRSVFSFAAESDALEQASLALIGRAVPTIDLRAHHGVHPRMGGVDVMPFVPLHNATMTDCVALARRVGAAIGARFDIPVYLYEQAATTPGRRRLEDIRRGGFEGLAAKMADSRWAPDFGPAVPHPTFGAIAVGARAALIAFNVNLASHRLDLAKAIASKVRERDGGLAGVKALGLALPARGIVQVSMNLTDYEATPPALAFDAVAREARHLGVAVLESELIGLIPQAALRGTTPEALLLTDFSPDRVLELRLDAAMRSQAG